MKSKELKVYNIPHNNIPELIIDAKPRLLLFLVILIGIVLLVYGQRMEGFALIVLSFSLLVFSPRVILMEFYNDYLIAYNKADKSVCKLIYYDEVVSWGYEKQRTRDYLYIDTTDGKREIIEAFSKNIFESYMCKYMRNKQNKNNR